MFQSYLVSLLFIIRTALCLHNSDVWLGQMNPHLSRSSNRIETFLFPNKKMFNVKDTGSSTSRKKGFFKLRDQVAGNLSKDRSLRIHPNRYVIQGNEVRN